MSATPVWAFAAIFLFLGLLAFLCSAGFVIAKVGRKHRESAVLIALPVLLAFALLLIGGMYTVRSTQRVAELQHAESWEAQQTELELRRRVEQRLHGLPTPSPIPPIAPPVEVPQTAPVQPREPQATPGEPAEPVPASAVATSNAIPATDDRTTSGMPQSEMPDWIRAGVQKKGDVTILVCSSRQYATQAEAEADARAAVQEYLLIEQQRMGQQPFSSRQRASIEPFVSGAIKDRYVEHVQRDFGTMFATMFRVWLKVEITPALYHQLQLAQLASVQEGRAAVVGAGLLAALCIPLGVVSFGQLNRWSGGRHRVLWKGAVIASVLGAWTVGFVLLQRMVTLF